MQARFAIEKSYVGALLQQRLSFGSCKCSKGKPQDLFIKSCDFVYGSFYEKKCKYTSLWDVYNWTEYYGFRKK